MSIHSNDSQAHGMLCQSKACIASGQTSGQGACCCLTNNYLLCTSVLSAFRLNLSPCLMLPLLMITGFAADAARPRPADTAAPRFRLSLFSREGSGDASSRHCRWAAACMSAVQHLWQLGLSGTPGMCMVQETLTA